MADTERHIVLSKLYDTVNKLPENLKGMVGIIVNQVMAVYTLEQIVNQIKSCFLKGNTELPFISYIRHNLDKVNSYPELAYIIELLQECWLINNPWYKTNTICKLSEEDALDATLSQFNDGDSVNFLIELDKDPYLGTLNLPAKHIRESRALQEIYKRYLDNIKNILIPRVKTYGYEFLDGFTLDTTIVRKKLSKKQIEDLSAYLIDAEYILHNDKQAFCACFQNTLHAADHRIKWLGRNSRNKERPSIATLYCLFESLDVNMSDENNRKKISALFEDFNGNDITYAKLKIRPKSSVVKKMSEKIKQIISEEP